MTTNRELLFSVTRKDLDIEAFKGSGNGGQNRNVRQTACRIRHRQSGTVVEAQEHRTFDHNRKAAFLRLTAHPKFRSWMAIKTAEMQGVKSVDQRVDEAMCLQNLKIEVRDKGKWVDATNN